jgi:hypothetical protein
MFKLYNFLNPFAIVIVTQFILDQFTRTMTAFDLVRMQLPQTSSLTLRL